MILQNQKQVGEKKIANKAGGNSNENNFCYKAREERKHKVLVVPSINSGASVKFEQGWNNHAVKKDVVRITIGDKVCITEREYLEQALFAMSEGDELLKYCAPKIS